MRLSKVMSKNVEVPSSSRIIDSAARRLFYVLSERQWDAIRHIVGRVLTIIEASIQDQEQRKALKDVLQEAIYGHEDNSEILKDILIQFFEEYAPTLMGQDEKKFWEIHNVPTSQNYFPKHN